MSLETKFEQPILTIAIICKNEVKNIRRCLDSVFIAKEEIGDVEVIVVDSYSTDGTIEIVKEYPVKLIRLKKHWPHSPAAGRYTAFKHSKGKYTLSLDGDMELLSGFLPKAIDCMEKNQKIGGVTGIIEHVISPEGNNLIKNIDRGELFPVKKDDWNPSKPCLLKSIPGAGLFRTQAVRDVGNFQPFLRAEEEYELCQRLRKEGFLLYYLPLKIARHYGYENDLFVELKRRLNSGFIAGIGEMFKWSLTHGYLRENAIRFAQHLLLGAYILLLPIVILLSVFYRFFIILWLIGLISCFLLYFYKKKNVKMALIAFLNKVFIGLSIYFHLTTDIKSTNLYPTDVIVIDLSKMEIKKEK